MMKLTQTTGEKWRGRKKKNMDDLLVQGRKKAVTEKKIRK